MNSNLIKLLLKLKNASSIQKENVVIKYNKFHLTLLHLLYKEGFIQSYKLQSKFLFGLETREICITLRYFYGKSSFKNLKIISSPSHLKYLSLKDVFKLVDKNKILFLSTNKGLLTNTECKKQGVAGKLLFVC